MPLRPHPVLNEHYGSVDERPAFVLSLFNQTARYYDAVNYVFSLGTGAWYRRQVLRHAGLCPGMRVLDIATGTGLVARAAERVAGPATTIIGLDLSETMLRTARRHLAIPLIQAQAEALPIADASIDFISLGYALRHVEDLDGTFREFYRVLRPGGTLLLMELARPAGRLAHAIAALYIGHLVPRLCTCFLPRTRLATLMRYYWDTIESCIPTDVIVARLAACGFTGVTCETQLDLFRAYRARRPGSG